MSQMDYKVEAAPSGRSHCHGPQPCNGLSILIPAIHPHKHSGSLIGYGDLRLGVNVKFYEKYSVGRAVSIECFLLHPVRLVRRLTPNIPLSHISLSRHWKCVTQTQMENILNTYSTPERCASRFSSRSSY